MGTEIDTKGKDKAPSAAEVKALSVHRGEWEKDKAALAAAFAKASGVLWDYGDALRKAESRGHWQYEALADGSRKYKGFSAVIEDLTPFKRAYGYQAIAMAKRFKRADVLEIGQSKSLRLAAALEICDPPMAEGAIMAPEDIRRLEQVRALVDAASDMTLIQVDEALGKILGRKPRAARQGGGATTTETETIVVGDKGVKLAVMLPDGIMSWPVTMVGSHDGKLMTGTVQIHPQVDLRVEVRNVGNGVVAQVSLIVPEPEEGEASDGSNHG